MLERDIKRLPVVDDQGDLVGIVSRVDVLRAFAQPLAAELPRQLLAPGPRAVVAELMTVDVPTVHRDASLAEVVGLLVSHRQRRVVVVDDERRAVGIISDGDLLKRAQPTERSDIILSLSRGVAPDRDEGYRLAQRSAAQVMTAPVISVGPDTALVTALQLLLEHHIKRLPVVDDQGRLVGLVGRGGILQALMQAGDSGRSA
jgi:CBS domain-containing protein